MPSDAATAVAARYARFARDEAPGRSALYEQWASGVVADTATQELLARIPAERRQPPLVFAVTRLLGAPEAGYDAWAAWLRMHADEVAAACVRRGLQTNEPLRCAALLPALSVIPGPLALLEIGASAGLCLYPDRYSYRYDGGPSLDPDDGPSPVILHSRLVGGPSVRLPEIVWRAGIDLAPLDVRDPDDIRFLRALVWPGETGRAERIDGAIAVAASDPPRLVRGDATAPGVVADLAARAPAGVTLVITTPGVLPHIPAGGRTRLFAEIDAVRARRPDVHWLSLDPVGLHDRWGTDADGGGFMLGTDDRVQARVDPLGAWVEWLPEDV